MSGEIRYIVNELSKPPFNKNYNLITFDSLQPEQLLQILNDVFFEIDKDNNKIDVREEEPEDMTIRMLNILRILKYRPPEENKATFRAGLVAGQKHVVYPILIWLLQNIIELKKRSYLAKFLVRLDIPTEFLGDVDIADVVSKNDELMNEFKESHKKFESLKSSGFSTSELKQDIASIEEERDLVLKRIERLRQKTDGLPNQEGMMESAKNLRQEKEKQKEMIQQENDLLTSIQMTSQRSDRLEAQLRDMRKASVGVTPAGLIQRLEEEVNVNNYIVNEKLPKEAKQKEKLIEILSKISREPAMGPNDLDDLDRKIETENWEINNLNEKRMKDMEQDETVDGKMGKLSFYRQNAVIISRKKEQTAERLNDMRNELNQMYDELKDKQEQIQEFSGEQVLRGDDFKLYLSQLKGKSSAYKLKKAEINELKAEHGILSRTEEILKMKDLSIEEQVSSLEASSGLLGFRDAQTDLEKISTQKAAVDERKGNALVEMSELVDTLNRKISERKANLAPLLREVRPLRESFQTFNADYNDKKSTYDSIEAGLELNMSKLENEVKSLKEATLKHETKHRLSAYDNEILTFKLQQAEEEMKLYLNKDDQKKSLRDQLIQEISDHEKQSWMLKEEQKSLKDLVENSVKQFNMWQDLLNLLEIKKSNLEKSRQLDNFMRDTASESIVL